MRRLAFPLLLLVLVAVPATARTGPALPATVRVVECTRGADAQDRVAVFRAAMRDVPGTHRMWMRFTLQERSGGSRWRSLKAPGLGVWRKSRPDVRRFAHRQRVVGLPTGSAYRVAVRYRWYAQDGDLLRRAARKSRRCAQPGTLADLRPVRIEGQASPGSPTLVRYVVHVRNRGRAAAQRFGVRLAVDGDPVDTRMVERLEPGEVGRVAFVGPQCKGGVEARADPADVVREADELDNSLATPCPPR